ncbi:MAG: FAD-dependent oxidoreductase [Candidatus Dormibacteria bacterium]
MGSTVGFRAVRGGHAVVLGASMAGLLAARVLAEQYSRVTVVERDAMPPPGVNRRGVPQGRHVHGLHPRGREILDELFPGGFTAELVADGAATCDVLNDCRYMFSGHRLRQAPSGLCLLVASRPFVEGHVRARVAALAGVSIAERCAARSVTTDGGGRVTGVAVHRDCGVVETLASDLVVDATGRGSRLPVWLAQLGYPRPLRERVEVGIGYATRTFRLRPGALGADTAVVIGPTPQQPRAGFLIRVEGGLHMVSVSGMLGDYPPTDLAGFGAFATSLAFPDIAEVLRGAEPVADASAFRFPASVRHRYEWLGEFPGGLLAIGDAVCLFNPVYGQGMTAAGIQAVTLRGLLADAAVPPAGRYFTEIARVIDTPWQTAVGADLAFPGVTGERTEEIQAQRLRVSAARGGRDRRGTGRGVPAGDRDARPAAGAVPARAAPPGHEPSPLPRHARCIRGRGRGTGVRLTCPTVGSRPRAGAATRP